MRTLAVLASALLAVGCSSSPAPAEKPAEKPVMSAKPAEPARAPAPKPVAPVAADLSKAKFEPDQADLASFDSGEGRLFYYINATATVAVTLAAEAEYTITVNASCNAALNKMAIFKVAVDGRPVGAETTLSGEDEKPYAFTAKLPAGERKISIQFTNDEYKEGEYDRNFYVHSVTLKAK
jgi:hypothetical protein